MERPSLVLITGPPGTGKSTLAEHASALLNEACVLGWDWVMAALTPFAGVQDVLAAMPVVERRQVGWSILANLSEEQLRFGRSVIIDAVARDAEVERAALLADRTGATLIVIVVECTDRDAHRARIEGRRRDIPGWHELDWDHVEQFLAEWQPPARRDVVVDTAFAEPERLLDVHLR